MERQVYNVHLNYGSLAGHATMAQVVYATIPAVALENVEDAIGRITGNFTFVNQRFVSFSATLHTCL